MRTTILILLFALSSTQLIKSQTKVHHNTLGLSSINSINSNEFYATLGGLGHTIFTKVTLDPLNFEYLEEAVFETSMTSFGLIGKKGIAIDYQGANYETNDGFQTLEKLADRKFKKVVNTSTGLVALGTDNNIYFTLDLIAWEVKAASSTLYPNGNLIWGVNDDGNLIISENGGKHWGNPVDISQFDKVQQVSFVANSSVYLIHEGGKGKLHISADKGVSWKTVNGFSGQAVVFNFMDEKYGFANVINSGLFCTKDGGENWLGLASFFPTLPENGTPQLWAVMADKIFININGKLYYTTNRGESWIFFHNMINGNKFYDIHQKGNVIIAGGPNGAYFISKDGGKIFKYYKWGNEDIMAVGVIDENTYALGDRKGQVLMLYEGGTKFSQATTSSGNYNALHFETSADGKTILSTRIGQPAISIDGGQTFKFPVSFGGTNYQTMKPNGDIINVNQGGIITKVNPANGQKTELLRIDGVVVKRISMATDNVGYLFCFKNTNTLSTYVTKDGWASVQPAGDIENIGLGYISVSHIADGQVIITADGRTAMYETNDYGTTWFSNEFDLLRTFSNRVSPIVGSYFSNANNFWLVTETGYLFWNDGEISTPTLSYIYEKNKDQNLQVYPNPATQSIYVRVNNIDISTIEIFNLKGEKVFKQIIPKSNTIDISNLSNGMYIIKTIATNGQIFQSKIVKQ